jgi:integrase
LFDGSLVVARVDGESIQPRSLTHEWHKLIAKRGLRRIRFNDLRHTHTSQMLAPSVHPKVASERLGHSSIGLRAQALRLADRPRRPPAEAVAKAAVHVRHVRPISKASMIITRS